MSGPVPRRRLFVGSVDAVAAAVEWVEREARGAGLNQDTVYSLQVCAEEILGNVLRHGGQPAPNILLLLASEPGRARLTVEDDGPPFDPVAAAPHRVDRPLADLQVGGLGIGLVHAFASHLAYERGGLGNRLVIDIAEPALAGGPPG